MAVVVTAILTGGTMAWAGGGGPTFNDVPESHTFYEEIEWMAQVGITQGYPDGGYHPNEPVTRQAMSAFMQRVYDLQEDFAIDSSISSDVFTTTTFTALADPIEVRIPPGVDGYVVARFAAESSCAGGGGHCIVRLTMDDSESGTFVPMEPDPGTDFAFDSNDGGNETDASWEAHAMERYYPVPGGCTCRVRVEARVISPAELRLDDWTLVAETDLLPSDVHLVP
jgi:hypothetical protein